MRQTKIKIDVPIIFIDTAYDMIVWFTDISGNRIKGWSYNKVEHIIEVGSWDKSSWEKFIKEEKMHRFIKLGEATLPPEYSKDLLKDLFQREVEKE